MIDFNACRSSVDDNIITAKGRMDWPFLVEPNSKAKGKDGKLKYQLSLLFPPGTDLKLLKDAAGAAAIEAFGAEKVKELMGLNRFNVPFHDAFEKSRSEKNPAGDEWRKGWTLVRSASLMKPGVVGPNGVDIYADAEVDFGMMIYAGRWATASLKPNAYPPIDGGKHGVTFWLQNVQLLDHDDRIGGGGVRAEDEFSAVDTGETASDGKSEGASADSVFG